MAGERRNPPLEELHARRWPIFGVAVIALFMALMDATVVNIAIPQLRRDLDADLGAVSWIPNAYNLPFAVLLIPMGRLADQFGRRRFFLIGIGVFTAGSLMCALAWSIEALYFWRVVQAVGAAILIPLGLATTILVFPPEQRTLGLALVTMVGNIAAALGPVIGGLALEYASWHWIFAVNVPVGVAGFLLARRVMPESYDLAADTRIDWWGSVLIGGALFALLFALVEADDRGWISLPIVGLFALSALLLGGFGASQRWGRRPMLSGDLLRNRRFAAAAAAMLLFATGVSGMLIVAVLAFVDLWEYSHLSAAYALVPVPGMALVVAPLVGRYARRSDPGLFGLPALAAFAAGLGWVAVALTSEPDYGRVLPGLLLAGIGLGASFPAINIGGMGAIRGQQFGVGSGILNMCRAVGFSVGVAVVVAIVAGSGADPLAGYRGGFLAAAAAAAMAVPFAVMMRTRAAT